MALTEFQQAICRLIAANRLEQAREIVATLPAGQVGTCVLHRRGDLYQGNLAELRRALSADGLIFHPGRIRGAYPEVSG